MGLGFLKNRDRLWVRVVASRWGNSGGLGVGYTDLRVERTPVGWWGEVVKAVSGEEGGWFEEGVVRVIGNGEDTLFWREK